MNFNVETANKRLQEQSACKEIKQNEPHKRHGRRNCKRTCPPAINSTASFPSPTASSPVRSQLFISGVGATAVESATSSSGIGFNATWPRTTGESTVNTKWLTMHE
jgi:hypothetical protein